MMENCESEIIDLCFDMGDDELLEVEADDLVMEDNITSGSSASDRLREHKDGIDNDMGIALDGIDFDEEMEEEDAANISVGLDSAASHVTSDEIGQSSGFDFTTGRLWIYPTNYPVRDYQYNIVQQALYKNTLVVLPTGLGKTFIAAVVMYNLYRWFPQGKIVFMAPTKPLVAQQIHACYNIMGIPKADTIEMTGTMPPAARQKAWKEKRVVFLTPQVMTNDLSRGSCTADSVKCLVVDEAHKALGNHAYCQVVRELVKFTRAFRVLALSATPGGDLKAVQQVMNNLLISHIELRSEESIDIRPYTHERKVDKVVVPMGEELKGVRLQYIQIMTCVIQRLIRNRVLYNREATKLSKFLILKARDEFRQNPPQNMQQIQYGNIEADFALAMSLYHGFELLQLHGLRSLYNFLMGIIAGEKGYGRTRSELMRNADFNSIMETLRQKFSAAPNLGTSSIDGNKIVVGHPKMQRLEEIVVEHFQTFQKRGEETRVMIFSQYRDSVQEISAILNQHKPLVKVMPFIGQSSVGKATKGYTQKEQLKVMREFRQGGYNTLVSTCVGEEGLDIGDVDLIVCFDAHKSPIRLVQRMGRTGRKRQGRIVMLVTEGKEEQIYNQSVYSKKSIHKAILNGARSLHFYPNNPRLVPSSIHPECHKMYITVATTDTAKKKETASNSSKSTTGSRNRKISDVFGKQAKRPADDGMLTLAEFEEIRHEFSQVPAVAKCLPKPKCITLTSEREAVENKSSSSVINLSEWMPWQNRLQGTRLVGHSIQSQHLVKIAEFMEIQNCIGEEEDTYGIEMRTFLNKEDIFEGDTTVGQSSIVSFLAPVEDHSRTKEKSSVRDEAQSIIVNSDSSSEELPASFDQVSESLKCKSSKLFTEIKNSKNKSSLSNSVKKILKKSTKSLSKSQTRKGKKFLLGSQTSVRKSQLTKETLSKKSKSIARKGQSDVPTGRKTKSISKLFGASTSDLPCSKDSDDFDTNMIGGTCHEALSMHEVCEVEGNEINCSAVDANNHVNDIVYDDTPQASGEIPSYVAVMKTELGNEFDERTTENGEAVTECRERIHIPTPPPVSEVRELFSNPSLVLDFAAIQLEDLVEEWKRSDKEECTAFKAKHHEFMLEDKAGGSSCTHRSAVKPLTNTICDSTLLRQKSNLAKRADHKTDKAVLDFGDDGTDVSDTKKPCSSKSGSSPCTILAENHSNANKSGSCANKSDTPSSPKSPAFKSLTSIMAERKTPKVRKSITFNEPNLQDLESEKNINRSHQKSMERDGNKELQNSVNTKMNLSVSNSEMKCGAAAQKSLPQIIENMNQNNMFDFDLSLDMDFDVDTDAHMHSKTSDTPSTSTGKSKEHSESFVTFTQALECLQTSSSESYSENMEECSTPHHSLSKSEKFFKEAVKKCVYAEGNKVSDNDGALKHIISPDKDSHSNLCSPISKGNALHPSVHGAGFTTPVKQQDTCHDDLDLPQFDLGFDLEDDIIPPTPPKDTSQTSSVCDVLMQTSQKRLTDEFSALVSQKNHQVSQSSHSNADVPQENQFEDEEEIIKALSNDEVNNDEWLLNNDSDIELEPNTEMEAGEKSIMKHLPEVSAVTHTVKLTDVNNENSGMRRDRVHFAESLLVSSTSEKIKSSAQMGEATCTVSSLSHHHQKIPVSEGTSNNLSQDFEGNGNESVLKDKKYIAPDFRNKNSSGLCSPSPLKRKKLPFDRYCESSEVNDVPFESNACNVEHQDKGNIAHGNMEHQDKGNPAPGNIVKSKTGKLRLGKRRQCITGTDRTSKISTTSADTSDSSTAHEKYKNVDQLVDGDRKREEDKNKNFTEYKKQDSISRSRLEQVLPDFSLQADCKDEDSVLTERKMLKASTPIRPILGEIHNSRVVANDDDDLENLTPIKELHMTVNDEEKYDSEESFFIRRRKKPATALNVSSDQDSSMKDVSSKSSSKASTDSSSSKQSNSSTDERKSKSVSYDRHHLSLVEEFDDMEDFEDDASNLVHRKPVLREEEQVGKKKRKKKSKGTEFIDKEAEVSGDDELSSDEHEGMDDYYECSFVDDNTEMTQANDTDMRAVYLKSVKSPPVAGYAGRYKLHGHRNEYRDIDIYSQALPEDQGMSEYEEDSFCVDDDEEAISYVEEESSLEEITKGKRKTKDNGRKLGNSKKTLGKRRIKRISDSSSDEEEGNRLPATQEFTAPQPIPGRRILLSSSEDEWDKKSSGHPRQKSTNEKCSSESDNIHSKHSSESKASDFGNFSVTNKRDSIANQEVSNVGITSVTRDKNMTRIKDVHNDTSRKQDTQSEKMLEPGNFNLLDDDDWFADFDVPVGNDTSREMVTKPFSSGEALAKTKSPFRENKFLSLKSKAEFGKGNNESSYAIDCENEKRIPIRDKEESFGNLKTSVKHGGSLSGTTSICQVAPIIISSQDDQYSDNIQVVNYTNNPCNTFQVRSVSENKFQVHNNEDHRSSQNPSTLHSSQKNSDFTKPSVAMTREERLRKQKEKQEKFRQKLAQVERMKKSAHSLESESLESVNKGRLPAGTANNAMMTALGDSTSINCDLESASESKISPVFTKIVASNRSEDQLQILVDSREISGAQEIISSLRLKHGINVTAWQLSSCDYILSNHLAADRVNWSTFSNSSNRNKISQRLCEMQALYDRCVLIVEADRVKPGQEKNRKPAHHTKYLDTTLSYIAQSRVKLYFTDNAEETSALLSDLCHVEGRKGRALTVSTSLLPKKQEMLNFLLSFPKMTVPQALNLTQRFRSVAEMITSPATVIQERGCMSLNAAQAVYKFLRHQFDIQMMPNAKR